MAILAVVIVGSVVGVTGALFLRGSLPGIVSIGEIFRPSILESKPIVRILMLGEDNSGSKKTGRHGLSDTLVVLAINNQTNPKQIRAISIPRDTRVEIPGHGFCKINSANVFGGPELSKEVIERILGVDIDYYLATSTGGLRGLVDMVGGVYIIVEENMNYDDKWQDLHIHLKASPEKQLLNGVEAEGYVRFRHDRWGDSGWRIVDGKKVPAGRIARQQYFMRALANRVLALPTKRERADVLSKAYEKGYIMSDLNLKDWGALVEFMKNVDPEKMGMAVLPGGPGMKGQASYWIPDDAKIPEVVAKQMRFESGTDEDSSATVEVLNGCGVVGAAGKVAQKLQEAGFQVTKQGNVPGFTYDRCCVITRRGNTTGVQRIASLLSCTDIREEARGSGRPDVTVIVGRDYSDSGNM
ncbi:MAG: LytR family transcriptional regulator [Gemmatimonadales bacterium]|nr:MAG: LytR family transcriptional regulator [Gemmatimonadales bacterium]